MLNNSISVIDLTKSNNYQQINVEIDKLLNRYLSLKQRKN